MIFGFESVGQSMKNHTRIEKDIGAGLGPENVVDI